MLVLVRAARRGAQRSSSANKQPPRYDRRCRDDDGRADARREAEAEGRELRRAVQDAARRARSRSHDAIHGETTFDLATLDDFVMLKSDGFPTYHLAYIVDDEAMKITHVLRGDEWMPSAPRHVLIYRALGIEPPVIAHLPRVLGPDGAKLSKRHGATSVFEYRDQGYLPDAMFNFLALIGWSLDDKTEIMSREQFIEHFTLDRVVKNPGDLQRREADVDERRLHPRDAGGAAHRRCSPSAWSAICRRRCRGRSTARWSRRIAPLIRERVKLLSEVADYCDFFFADDLHYSREDLLGKAYAGRAARCEGRARARRSASCEREPCRRTMRSKRRCASSRRSSARRRAICSRCAGCGDGQARHAAAVREHGDPRPGAMRGAPARGDRARCRAECAVRLSASKWPC